MLPGRAACLPGSTVRQHMCSVAHALPLPVNVSARLPELQRCARYFRTHNTAGHQPLTSMMVNADGGATPGRTMLASAAKTGILREVDKFVSSLPLGTGAEDAEVEEAVASRLYRAELQRAEAQAKLSEW